MSTSPTPRRLLTGLATAAVALGLIGMPVVAFAEPTPTPIAKPAATSSPTPRSTPTDTATTSAPVSTSPSPSESPSSETPSSQTPSSESAAPSPSESASGSPSESESSAASPSPAAESPSPEPTGARMGGDALAVPGPTESAAPASELAAQAVVGPSIALAKAARPTRVSRVGEVVTYTFRATNDGSVPLTDVRITDELEGLSALSCSSSGAELAPGAALSCSATLTVTQAVLDFGDLFNFATVFGSFPVPEAPDDYVGANAATRVTVDQSPSIALKASVSPTGTADRGDRLRYTGTATNTGNVTLTAARITSSLSALDLDCDPSSRATLAPGASVSCAGSYRVSAADARRGRVSTELTARAERPFGDTSASSDDVTDDVRLRVAVTKPAATADHGLADTGGPALPLGLAGLAAVGGGLVLLRRSRRV